jgi:GT2 family glycosyltransferase
VLNLLSHSIKKIKKLLFRASKQQIESCDNDTCHKLSFSKSTELLDKVDVGIHLDLTNYELLDDTICFLSKITFKFVLYVSLPYDIANKKTMVYEKLSNKLAKAMVIVRCSDKQTSFLPLLNFQWYLIQHQFIVAIHTKKYEGGRLENWRRQLIANLLGSSNVFNAILNLFIKQSDLGIVFPEYHPSLNDKLKEEDESYVLKNIEQNYFSNLINQDLTFFPYGGMFVARLDAIKLIFKLYTDLNLVNKLFYKSNSGLVVDKLMGYIVHYKGYKHAMVQSDKPFQALTTASLIHPYRESNLISKVIKKYVSEKKHNNKIAVYTAITNDYDIPVRHTFLDPAFDYILFTNKPIENQGFWDVRPIDYYHTEASRMSRFIKTNPHIHLKEYDIVIWIDGNVIINNCIRKYVDMLATSTCPIGTIPHPIRNCAYDEALAIVSLKKDITGRAQRQIASYSKELFPRDFGLIESNFMISNLNHSQISTLMSSWWSEIMKHSHRDQLSFPYVLWRHKLSWLPLMEEKQSLRDNFDFILPAHGKESGYIRQNCSNIKNNNIVSPLRDYKISNQKHIDIDKIDVDIIICVHNALDDVKKCIQSVLSSIRENDRVIIVDDASNLPTQKYLQYFSMKYKFILHRNDNRALGYCFAANQGMSLSSCEYMLLLNSDTIITKKALETMIKVATLDRKIGIVGPMSNAASYQSIPNIKGSKNQTAINTWPLHLSEKTINELCTQWSVPSVYPTVPLVHGFCQLINKDLYNCIGGFDEKNFPNGYGEENDFCLRAIKAGFTLKIATNSYVYHRKSASYTDAEYRGKLMQSGLAKLKELHTEDLVNQSVLSMKNHPLLNFVRVKAAHYLEVTKSSKVGEQ